MKRQIFVAACLLTVAACGYGNGVATTTEPITTSSGIPGTTLPVTTTVPASTIPPSTAEPQTTTAPAVTTTVSGGISIEDVVATVQRELDERFDAENAPEGVSGPVRVTCDDTGTVERGDVFACTGVPQTEPDFQLDAPGMVFAVLDDAGRVAWTSGTDLPTSTDRLLEVYESVPSGLHCRDLAEPVRDDLSIFAASGATPEYGYFISLVYWFLEGSPDRMDADQNGIPCETRYDAGVVSDVWQGGDIG